MVSRVRARVRIEVEVEVRVRVRVRVRVTPAAPRKASLIGAFIRMVSIKQTTHRRGLANHHGYVKSIAEVCQVVHVVHATEVGVLTRKRLLEQAHSAPVGVGLGLGLG